jgi:hypothetical protein
MNAGAEIEQATPEGARYLTDKIKVALEGTWQLIAEAYVSRAWAVLGYGSWDEYLTREFGTTRLKLPREDRQEVVASLRDSGLSTRAIAAATGVSHTQVRKDLNTSVGNPGDETAGQEAERFPTDTGTPPRPTITGSGGRSYPASRPQPPRPAPSPVLPWGPAEDDEIVEAEIVEDDEQDEVAAVQAVIDHSGQAQAYRDAQWRKELGKAVDALNSVTTFDPERAVAICDDDLLFLIDANCKAIAAWHAEVSRLRKPGLRVLSGGAR